MGCIYSKSGEGPVDIKQENKIRINFKGGCGCCDDGSESDVELDPKK